MTSTKHDNYTTGLTPETQSKELDNLATFIQKKCNMLKHI